jgi:hypothetical protein
VKIACVGEGDTEYFCVPKIIGRLGHIVVSNANLGGCCQDWDQTFTAQILPYVRTAALKRPDKILIVLDREKRPECCPSLVQRAITIVTDGLAQVNLSTAFSIIVSDKKFESVVMADYELVDKLPILERAVSPEFGDSLDGKDPKTIVDRALKPGTAYHKVRHGGALASRMRLDSETVLQRSRSLRKLVKELT